MTDMDIWAHRLVTRKKRNLGFRPVLMTLLIGVALYLAAAAFGDISKVAESVNRVSLGSWVIVLFLSLVNYGLRFFRWDYYLKTLGHSVARVPNLLSYFSGFAFTTTPGKAGEAVRSLHLKPYGVTYASSVAALFAERFADFVSIVLLGSLAFATSGELIWVMYVGIFACALILFTLWHPSGMSLTDFLFQPRGSEKIQMLIRGFAGSIDSARVLLNGRLLLSALAVGVPAWFAEAVGLFIIIQQLGQSISILEATGVYALGMLAGALSFVPGGLGSTEAVMVILLSALGVPTTEAIAGTLVCRVATLWFSVLLGVLATAALAMVRDRRPDKKEVRT
jgi:uncharacterized protein (TIRG00374 family)